MANILNVQRLVREICCIAELDRQEQKHLSLTLAVNDALPPRQCARLIILLKLDSLFMCVRRKTLAELTLCLGIGRNHRNAHTPMFAGCLLTYMSKITAIRQNHRNAQNYRH